MRGMGRRGGRSYGRGVLVAVVILGGIGAGGYAARRWLFPGALERGVAAYDRGDWAGAAALADERLKAAPGDREALRLLARSAARRGRDASARALYTRLGGAGAMAAEDFYLLGGVVDRAGDRETARACWVAGLAADPKHPGLLVEFARLYLSGGQYDRAARIADTLAGRPGWETRGDLLRGRIALEQADPERAASCLRRALDRDPEARGAPDPPSSYRKLLARALLRLGRPVEAEPLLRTVLAARPDAEASWLLSRVFLQRGSTAEAAAALKQAASYREGAPLEPEAAPYVGAARCAECHGARYRDQQSSLHARTFRRAPDLGDLPLPGHPLPDPRRREVRHAIARSGGRVAFATEADGTTARAVVDYIFGSGHRGLTPVGVDGAGRARELRLSYYADGPAWDVTTGHPAVPPAGEGYLGRFLSADDVDSCLACHTTVARSARERKGPESADRGIGCERCHGPGGNHLAAVAVGFPDLAVARPRADSGAQVVALCGQCHAPFKREVTRTDPIAVRFPAVTLTWSRCYTESGGTFDCRTCHDPHRDAATTPAHYEARCLSCHTAPRPGGPKRVVCPVNPSRGCVACHMPRAKIEIPHSVFTDHHIRVHPAARATE